MKKDLLYVLDLESETGTYVNGTKILERTLIRLGDVLGLSRYRFTIHDKAQIGPTRQEVDESFLMAARPRTLFSGAAALQSPCSRCSRSYRDPA